MGRIMFPFSPEEIARRDREQRKKPWTPTGFFNQFPLTPRQRQLKCESTRTWLLCLLYGRQLPSREVYRLAAIERIPPRSLRKAKRHFRVTSVKTGFNKHWIWCWPKQAQ